MVVTTGTAAGPVQASPGQARGNGVATLILRDVVLVGISIGAASDDDSGPAGGAVPVVRLDVRSLVEASSLDLARPTSGGSLRIAARSAGGGRFVSARGGVVLDATWACVRGLGITRDRILSGVLDGALNEALAVDPAQGFQPTWVIWLANLIGATEVPVVVDELRAEVAHLDATALRLPGATVVRDARRLPPLPPCSVPPVPATGTAAGAVGDAQGRPQVTRRRAPAKPDETIRRLRRIPGLATLPDWRPRPSP